MPGDEAEARLLHAWTDAVDEAELPDGRVHHLVVDELLDPVQRRLAALAIHLGRLLTEEPVDVGVASVGEGTAAYHERFEPRRRAAERAARGLHHVLELLLLMLGEEGGPLERAELELDSH